MEILMSIDDLENQGIGSRLAKAVVGMTVAEAAHIAGCSQNTFRRWLKGEVAADARGLARIAFKTGKSLMWLVTGISDESGDELTRMEEIGYVPLGVLDIEASAGPGKTALESDPLYYVGFDREWLRGVIQDPAKVNILRIRGDSMEPELKTGDHIMVDRNDEINRARDGIYVFRLNNQLVVKRLRMGGKRTAELISSNEAYDPVIVDLFTDDFKIVGRVVWVGRVI
jgi:phage repressor protein C with HTH and peptisase S24 domain